MHRSLRNMMATQVNIALVSMMLLTLFIRRSFGVIIADGPVNMLASPGQWANFSCTVSCSYDIDWFVEGYSTDISETCTETRDGMMVCVETTQECSTTTSTSSFSQRLSLLAKDEKAGSQIAVQCVALSTVYMSDATCFPDIQYSKFAFLTVESLPTPEPTPALCPTPTPTVETVIVTSTVTETPPISIQTVNVPTTVLLTVTALDPSCTPTLSNTVSTLRRTHLSTVIAEALTWFCTLLIGLALL